MSSSRIGRRGFIQAVALGSSAAAAEAAVSIVADPADPVAAAGPAQSALQELEDTLAARGLAARRYARLAAAPPRGPCIVAGADSALAPEALRIAPARVQGRRVLSVAGADPRGLSYGLLELADRVQNSSDPAGALALSRAAVEQPANRVRGVARLFTSDVEDKPWFNDREMWPRYFTMLAAQRFNRFQLAFGIGYDFLTNVTDAYFLFAYPFLLSVPGYRVRVPQLPDAERDANLAMLRYIAELAVARGLHFQLGLWMHGYRWIDSPSPNYTIEGLSRETHGPYCRDAVRALLQACPAIGGITFRIHGESGVEEGSYDFWKTVFEGVATCGRRVEIDMHAKGMTPEMLQIGLATGMPLRVSPKYWAEHMGMPYMQAAIREQERPRADQRAADLMKFSAGSRSFLRYSYGDLLREDRRWSVMTRVWPGTQRLLLWGDPLTAAAHAEAFRFCGADGVEICEPLSFKGRRGSGIAGSRCGYTDASLEPKWDWQKYACFYRLWGRLTYNPHAEPDSWRRFLRARFGPAAPAAGAALANAARILPIVTTAYCPSAANNNYWPEMYTNQSLADAAHYTPYSDTPPPRVFGNASPLDPQLFSSMNEFAGELLSGERTGKYSPVEVAQWLEDYAAAAADNLRQAETHAAGADRPEFRRAAIDVEIQAGLGRFFGAKFRAGVLFAIYERTGDRAALDQAVSLYRQARAAWAAFAGKAKNVYVADITVGEHPWLRGHWLDRLPAIDADIERIARQPVGSGQPVPEERIRKAVEETLGRPRRVRIACWHDPPARFRPAQPLLLDLALSGPATARLLYRHVNQAERYQALDLMARGSVYRATIPADYTDSPYPLQYYFEVRRAGAVDLYPGFAPELNNQPYYVVRRA
jgi:hypothetical protein